MTSSNTISKSPVSIGLNWKTIGLSKLTDYLIGETRFLRAILAAINVITGCLLWMFGRKVSAFERLGKSHGCGYSSLIAAGVAKWVHRVLLDRDKPDSAFSELCLHFLVSYTEQDAVRRWSMEPKLLLKSRILVVKTPSCNEKGVIILDYSYVFPLFMQRFNVARIAEQYHLVLEPSWTGFCTLEILSYATLRYPVFIQASEPRDATFIDSLKTNLVTVPIAANWWVDYRIAKPDPGIQKEVDLIMVAAWAGFKRHWSFFECLSRMRRRNRRLTVTLVGYPQEYTMADIAAMATAFGVRDQIELHEWLNPSEVAKQLNRAKALVLWSRREGFNRAIIEAMLTDIPVIIRQDFNYGYKYPYINELTGAYATEKTFEKVVDNVFADLKRFSPRAWIMKHMTCHHATQILQQRIREVSSMHGETWTRDLVVKTTHLNQQAYWNESDDQQFDADYAYLASCIRTG
jgi:glycosyltransferase involved in cell wall biosynthesis